MAIQLRLRPHISHTHTLTSPWCVHGLIMGNSLYFVVLNKPTITHIDCYFPCFRTALHLLHQIIEHFQYTFNFTAQSFQTLLIFTVVRNLKVAVVVSGLCQCNKYNFQ